MGQHKRKATHTNSALSFEEMENRLLFSADTQMITESYESAETVMYQQDEAKIQFLQENVNQNQADFLKHEVAIIDGNIENHQDLISDIQNNLDPNTHLEIFILDKDQNGIEQISEFLNEREDLDAIHIYSHGQEGSVQLGNTYLNANTLDQNASQLRQWQGSLDENADILFYGCDLADSEAGQSLLNSISALTQADVAASTDITGTQSLGGDWDLEYNIGKIETISHFQNEATKIWQGTLESTIDFNALAEGEIVDTEYQGSDGVTISAVNLNGGPDVATTINSDGSASPDTDLQGPWAGGNLAGQSSNNILVVANQDTDANVDGLIDTPTAESGNPGGRIYFDFSTPITSFAADFIDVDNSSEWNNDIIKFIEINDSYDATALTNTTNALSPVMYLDLIETSGLTADDNTANNNDGTHIGNVSTLEGALYEQDAYTEIAHSTDFNLAEGSVSIWFKLDNLNSTQTLFSKDSSGYDTGGHLTAQVLADGTLQVRHQDTGANYYVNSTAGAISADQWMHMTYSWGPGGQELYIDNVLVDSSAVNTLTLVGNDNPITLGASQRQSGDNVANNLNDFLNGQLREFAIFDSQLNNTQINNLYSAGDGVVGSNVTVATVTFSEFTNPASQFYDPTITHGPNFANRINAIDASDLGMNHFDQVSIQNSGRLGIDNIKYDNTSPTAANNTITANEDVGYVFSAADFNYSDATNDPFFKIQITSLPSDGTLTLSGVAVTNNQVITVADINAGNLVFTAAANQNGNNYTNFQFKVSDGYHYSTSSYTMTIDLNAVNDAPTSTNNTVNTNEDTAYTFSAADFNYSDIEGDAFTQVRITSLPGAGALTLSGVAVSVNQNISIADINAGNLIFTPALNENGASYASFQFRVHDGTDFSASNYTMTVDVNAVNDAPTASNSTVNTNEDTAYTFSAADFNYNDVEGDAFTQIRITTLPGAGSLTLSGVAITLNQIVSIADINAGNLVFTPALNANGANHANFQFRVHDGSAFSASNYTMTIDVNAVNDAPTANHNTVITNEDTAYTFSSADFNYSDIEGDAFTQVRISSLPGAGTLTLSGVAVALNQIISVADINAGNLVFTPALNDNGANYANFQFNVHDGTTFSASNYTMTVDVIAVNDAPTASNHTVNTIEDTAFIFSAADFNYSDIEGSPLSQVQIISLPGAGTLTLSGVAVTLNQIISVADINAGNLVFTPAANETGNNYASFQFLVHDGTEYSASSYTMTIDVSATNDPPTASHNTVNTNEDVAYVFSAADFNYNDIDGDAFTQVQISGLPGAGTLTLSGVMVTLNQNVSIADINAGNLVFTPATNANGTNYANFQFKVHDGTEFSIASYTMTIDVTSVNDAPTANNNTVNTNEDTAYTFSAADFNYSDIEGDVFTQIQITNFPDAGILTLSGLPILLNQVVSIADINAGNLVFNPVFNTNGMLYASFEFKVHDGTEYSTNSYTMTIDVTPINDAPTASNNTINTNEDSSYTFSVADFNYSDIDGDAFNQVRITSLPGAGTLTLSGVTVTLNQIISTADINAGNLVFTPALNANGANHANFQFCVHDGAEFSAVDYTMTIDVTSINDAPTANNNTVNTNEDTAYTFSAADFNYSDIEGDAFTQIRIASLPGQGTLTLSGIAVNLNQNITIADINAGNLVFTPALNANGANYANFQFNVHDGTEFSAASYTMTIDVNAVNDAPTASNNTINTNEDTPYIFAAADFNYSDIEGNPLAQVQITSLPAVGSFTLSGVAVAINQVISIADINAGNLIFMPDANATGNNYANFQFLVHDGTEYSASNYTMTIDVTPENDAPTANNNSVVTNEDIGYIFSAADFNYTDIDGDAFAQIQISALPSSGALTLSGVAVTLNQVVSIADVNAGNLVFTPALNENGNNYANFQFKVHDGTEFSVADYTMNIDVIAINDAPTASNHTANTNEDTVYTFSAADFNYNDVEGEAFAQVQITSLPGQGALTLSGVAVTINQIVSIADINAGNLEFTPDLNANGGNYANFQFRVHDGADFSNTSYTMTIDVTAVNDAPTAANATVNTNEDISYTFASADFNYNDIEADAFTQIQITALPVAGDLTLSGVAVNLNDIITIADINAGNLVFTPSLNDNGANYASFQFKVHDGTEFSTLAYNMNIDVTAVNDAPTTGDITISFSEDTSYTIKQSDIPYEDVEGSPITQIQVIALPGSGLLTLSGSAVTVNQIISIDDINAGLFVFTPDPNAYGEDYANIQIRVSDGTVFSAAASTMGFNVIDMPEPLSPIEIQASPDEGAEPVQLEIENETEHNSNYANNHIKESSSQLLQINQIVTDANIRLIDNSSILSTSAQSYQTYDINVNISLDNTTLANKLASNNMNSNLNGFQNNQLAITPYMLQEIESAYSGLNEKQEAETFISETLTLSLNVAGVTATITTTVWLIKSSSLLATFLAATPVLSGFDPLPIVSKSSAKGLTSKNNKNKNKDDIDKLFESEDTQSDAK